MWLSKLRKLLLLISYKEIFYLNTNWIKYNLVTPFEISLNNLLTNLDYMHTQ